MYSNFFDPPDPNFHLSFVKVGPSVIGVVLIKFSQTFYRISFITYLTSQLFFRKTAQTSDQIWAGGILMVFDVWVQGRGVKLGGANTLDVQFMNIDVVCC